jgi:putative hydrolase of the HAD superfamily
MKLLKAVFFDLDDTLCDDAAAWVSSANGASEIAQKRLGLDPGPLAEAFMRRSEAYWMSLAPVTETRPLLDIRAQQWEEALIEVSGTADTQLAIDLGSDYGRRRSNDIALYPDALDTLAVLRSNGLKLALLTNGVQLTHVEKIKFLKLENEFDYILIADEVGSFKPDPIIFREAAKRCGCTPDEAIMVGDHLRNDIGGAQAAGIAGYWFNPAGRQRQPSDPLPKAEIKSLSELITLIEPRLP